MSRVVISLVAISFSAAAFPAEAKKKPQLSGLELQQLQSKDFDAPKAVTFPAVMSVLQDSGYRIGSADRDTGLITATASTKTKMTWLPFIGFGTSKKTPVVSAFIEDRGLGMSRVRLNFVMGKITNNNQLGGLSDEEPILDPVVYRDAFEKVSQAVFVRQTLDAQTQPAPSATPTAAAQAAQVSAPAVGQPTSTPMSEPK
jgi:hypothetical protein